MWYSQYIKTALRKHNLRVDLRIYPGDEEQPLTEQEAATKLKSILSSAIVKGLDVVGLVSRFGVEAGNYAKQIAEQTGIDLKVIPGQDYLTLDKYKVVLFLLQTSMQPGLSLQQVVHATRQQGGKIMLYDVSKSHAKIINSLKETEYAPDFVEIYNGVTKAYKDLDLDYPRVICSAARSGSELEKIPIFSEISRKQFEEMGFLQKGEGSDYLPGYLKEETNG